MGLEQGLQIGHDCFDLVFVYFSIYVNPNLFQIHFHSVTIDIHTHLIQSVHGAWHAKLLFVRDPRCMLSINNWFAHGVKSQEVGRADLGTGLADDHSP